MNAAGDVKRDPETGAVALRTTMPDEGPFAGEAWLVLRPDRGEFAASSAVANWTDAVTTPAVAGSTYGTADAKRNPDTLELAVRTNNIDADSPMAWMVGRIRMGTRFALTSEVAGWPDVTVEAPRVKSAARPRKQVVQ